VHLVLDWDGTLTVNDTMALLGKIPKARDLRLHERQLRVNAIARNVSRIKHGTVDDTIVDPPVPSPTSPQWSDFASSYMKDYEAHKAAHYPLSEHASHEEYVVWLRSLRPVEYDSAARVSDSGFFHGVDVRDVRTVVKNALDSGALQLRHGWEAAFELFLRRITDGPPAGTKLSILSVNWSATLIRHALHEAASRLTNMPQGRKDTLLEFITAMEIQSNEIDGLDSPDGSTGKLVGNIRTVDDKARCMPTPTAFPEGLQPLMVYVGDSSTDFECLRRADVAIWMCDCDEAGVKERFAKTFRPLDVRNSTPYPITEVGRPDDGAWCGRAKDLAQVAEFLKEVDHER